MQFFSGTCLLDGVGYPTVKIMGVLSWEFSNL